MVRDISSQEVTSSIGESGVPYSAEFQSRIIKHIKDKYNVSMDEDRQLASRARGSGAYEEGDYDEYARRRRMNR